MIFLDFDGVLFDTVREAYAVAVISSGKYSSVNEISLKQNIIKTLKNYGI